MFTQNLVEANKGETRDVAIQQFVVTTRFYSIFSKHTKCGIIKQNLYFAGEYK
ncbi:hypothetical protein HBE96_00290 [Clostridium sp. P21]|uniref:Uncharacterized protein n=1 Tax=Clostridium muellerianum TaxID=2716538 RepID=A0A7Y0EET3_9CLOT|nr:hypothetical protein [Clostridium muellerianum]NMM61165.1 hypothetical protein [Clostridium muellerianum]